MELRQPAIVGAALKRLPFVNRLVHTGQLWGSDILVDIVTRPSWRRGLVQNCARWSLRAQIRDRDLREQLTPDYQPLCKRQVLSGSYYRAISAPNARLVTSAIERITPNGIHTADGREEHDVDLLVFATGFKAHNYMRPMNLQGRDGLSIDDAWAKGPRAYRMTAIPGFPNFFTVLGPNSPTGSISLQYSAELTARYITHWLRRFRDGELVTVEVTEEATKRFADDVADALGPTVWNTGCNSWYLTDEGNVDLWPYNRKTLTAMLTELGDRDYLFTTAQSADPLGLLLDLERAEIHVPGPAVHPLSTTNYDPGVVVLPQPWVADVCVRVCWAIASAVRCATAIVEIIGLTPVAVGSALASPT